MQETKNKYAIITGSNRGIGKSLVREFAKQGYNIFACARKQNDFFEAFIYDVSIKENVIIEPIYFDLSNEKEVIEGIKQILGKKVRIDVLINNAGIAHGGLMAMTPISTIREVYEINVFAQIQIMQLVSRKMMNPLFEFKFRLDLGKLPDDPLLFGKAARERFLQHYADLILQHIRTMPAKEGRQSPDKEIAFLRKCLADPNTAQLSPEAVKRASRQLAEAEKLLNGKFPKPAKKPQPDKN